MCFVSFKFFFVIDSIDYLFDDAEERCDIILKGINFISASYPKHIWKTIINCEGSQYREIFSYKLIRLLLYKALIVVLTKRHFRYKKTIGELKHRLNKISIPDFKRDIDVKYISKLPECFKNVDMHRKMVEERPRTF